MANQLRQLGRVFGLCVGLVFAAVPVLTSAGCPGPEWPKCENDDQCKADRKGNAAGKDLVCVFGKCMECGRDSDCDEGSKCKEGRCEKLCKGDGDCPSGLACNESGDCVTPPPKAECGDGVGDCPDGERCQSGKCVAKKDDGPTEPALECQDQLVVNFEFGEHDLTPETRESLDTFVKCMNANTSWRLTVSGHADERGTTQFNLDLGDKRARSVKDYLERLGIKGNRMRTVSFGEERPLQTGSDEGSWAANRRAELVVKK